MRLGIYMGPRVLNWFKDNPWGKNQVYENVKVLGCLIRADSVRQGFMIACRARFVATIRKRWIILEAETAVLLII